MILILRKLEIVEIHRKIDIENKRCKSIARRMSGYKDRYKDKFIKMKVKKYNKSAKNIEWWLMSNKLCSC